MPAGGIEPFPHDEILRYEEIVRVARVAIGLGVRKIRLTGGEPLVRRDLPFLVRELSRLPGIEDLSMTTNGMRLAEFVETLKGAGLHRVNVSLDSLEPLRYKELTRGGDLERVWEGVMAAHQAGMRPIKINVVAIREMNADEILSFARLTLQWPFEVRFIEWMPLSEALPWGSGSFVPSEEILGTLRAEFSLEQVSSVRGNGPARLFQILGGRGTVGVISPLTRHFCNTCNRLRLTADGKLRGCLFSDEELDLKRLMREEASDEQIQARLREAILNKPKEHPLHTRDSRVKKCMRPMNRIGG
jgi:cyclic pyranopterin phosphate synthase